MSDRCITAEEMDSASIVTDSNPLGPEFIDWHVMVGANGKKQVQFTTKKIPYILGEHKTMVDIDFSYGSLLYHSFNLTAEQLIVLRDWLNKHIVDGGPRVV